jgi:hypothetical protein
MSGALKPQPFDEIAAQDALAYQFQKLGLEFSSLHPTIRTVMERAVIATGDVGQQVERFVLVARMADQEEPSSPIASLPADAVQRGDGFLIT